MTAMHSRFIAEVATCGLTSVPTDEGVVTERELGGLPLPVQRYLRWMGVVGRPRVWSFRLHCLGRFKPAIDADWQLAESWQYNSAIDVARIYHIKLHFYGVPVVARDLYQRGTGRLTIRPLDLATIEHDAGPEFDRSELVTWLNDAVLFAPSMLLGAQTEWYAVDDDHFDVSFTDAGHTVTARVTLDSDGGPLDFETDSRSMRDPRTKSLHRARWSTPIQGWQLVGGRRIPLHARAVWHLPAGDFAYVELDVRGEDIEFNVPASRDGVIRRHDMNTVLLPIA